MFGLTQKCNKRSYFQSSTYEQLNLCEAQWGSGLYKIAKNELLPNYLVIAIKFLCINNKFQPYRKLQKNELHLKNYVFVDKFLYTNNKVRLYTKLQQNEILPKYHVLAVKFLWTNKNFRPYTKDQITSYFQSAMY